jgi:hypothetical protein
LIVGLEGYNLAALRFTGVVATNFVALSEELLKQ